MVESMNRLRELRKKKKINQEEVAAMLGITQSAYSYWENGQVRIDDESLKKLSRYYNVSVDYILGNVPKPDRIVIRDEEGNKIGWVAVVDSAISAGLTPEQVKSLIDIVTRKKP